ncbi:MAG: hypothetical protein J3R72DRAFT_426959 [Linnemannia gamsii]|nr:MAG: hypothetical protein J3R72DRAFT_426959 [Linnemannia gamsii]
MLDWLERSGNYVRVFGASGKTTIGGKDNKSANVAIEEWASHVSKAGSFQLTGYGLSQDDYNYKIRTLAQKYGEECHAFERMDRIFGYKPNIHALASMEGGLATTLKIQNALVDIDLIDDNDDEGMILTRPMISAYLQMTMV